MHEKAASIGLMTMLLIAPIAAFQTWISDEPNVSKHAGEVFRYGEAVGAAILLIELILIFRSALKNSEKNN